MTDHHLTLEEMKQRGAKRGFEDDEGNLYFDDEAAWKEQEHVFADFVDGDGPFFASRGIHPAVRQARQYRYWDLEHAELVVEAWRRYMKMRRLAGKLVDNPHQLAQVRRWAEQSPGVIITRHKPPDVGADEIAPEIRPLEPIMTEKPTTAIERLKRLEKFDPEKAKKLREEAETTAAELEAKGLHYLADLHRKYQAANFGKYTHPPTPLKEEEHEHEELDSKDRPHHIRQKHEGEDVEGPHIHRVKDRARGQAKRIDVHPLAVSLLEGERTTRVFFALEGCMKNDAILSEREAVFSVPSVTLWDARELPAFARKYLGDRIVYVIVDADWTKKWQVLTQAYLCRNSLRGLLGHKRVLIAAPPTDENGEPLSGAYGPLKGADDFLAEEGYGIDDLVVFGREMPETFDRWMAEHPARIERVSRDAKVLQAMSLCAELRPEIRGRTRRGKEWVAPAEGHGELRKHVPTLLRIANADPTTGVSRDQLYRSLKSLKELGAIAIHGELTTKERGWVGGGYYDRTEDWVNLPVIRIRSELCAIDRTAIPIGDLEDALVADSFRQFVHRETTVERIRDLRAELRRA